MPSILVATDFSAAGNAAVHYACRLAGDLRYGLTVLHSYLLPVAFSETPMPLVPVHDLQQLSEEHLEGLMAGLRTEYPELFLESRLVYGDILDCLREETAKMQPALVVLGNSGAGNTDLWMGSTAVDILRHLEAPVLAVPAEARYQPVRDICLACDFKDIEEEMPVAPLSRWAQATGARLHVLHIDRDTTKEPQKYEDTTLPQLLAGLDVSYHYATAAGSLEESITRFTADEQMDWLAVIPHHLGFWDGLFHRSHTKAMARMSGVPVLALHAQKKQ